MKNKKLIKSFLEYIKNERKYSLHTIRCYRADLNEFEKFLFKLNKIQFEKIDRSAIQIFIQNLAKKGAADKTLQRKVATIKSFYKYLTISNKIEYNISELISSPKWLYDLDSL